jgi:hypothetical protein
MERYCSNHDKLEGALMKRLLIGCGMVVCLGLVPAQANEYAAGLTKLAQEKIKAFASSPEVIAAIKAQNAASAGYDEAKITELDTKWRAEAEGSDQPMIDEVLARPVSKMLADVQDGSDGLFTEIFVMDAKGLNVGQSEVTSDYWQGDEAKWKETFLAGPDAIHLSEVEEDESTQTFQSQVSMAIADPDSGSVIGAITVGVNVELME